MRHLILPLLCVLGCQPAQDTTDAPQPDINPRIIVLTDIENEPDDAQSLVRFLLHANEMEVEGLLATTSVWMQDTTREDKIIGHIEAYGEVRNNLLQHAAGFPEAQALMNVVKPCQPLFGMDAVGEGMDSPGSELIIAVVDRADPRPVWVTAWGGPNCLAQALWKVQQTRSPEALAKFISKLRVYTISDQDYSGPWMRETFPDLFYIVSPSGSDPDSWPAYADATWSGIAGDQHYSNGPGHYFELVDNPWLEANVINNHGPLGARYPLVEYIMEGDTPSFFNLFANGLAGEVSPTFGGWGGRYHLYQPEGEPRPIWTNAEDTVVAQNDSTYTDDQATIWRWREAYQHDLAARIDWSNTADFTTVNHHPVLLIDGHASRHAVYKDATPGETVTLDASGSSDPDGDTVAYTWWQYVEAGTYGNVIPVENASSLTAQLTIPTDAAGAEIHMILEAKDSGEPALTSYRRVVINVAG